MNNSWIKMNDESYVPVELKGYRDGLRLIIDSDASIAEIESAIKQRLANLGNSLAGTMVRIEQQNQSLSPQDISHFYSLMQQEYGLESLNAGDEIITMSRLTSSSTEKPIQGIPADSPGASVYNEPFSTDKEKAELIRYTLRSGQMERFLEGNIIVLGDVNPGAEVTASGDIIVLGNLRGIAHAGALGNIAAAVVAMNMEPTQLRIGNVITRPPARKRRRKPMMEVARIKQGNVIVEDFEEF
ncbi:TPA: septum site-determining protein MinC [Candidatus Poribacteria bacterium]|jgi:septum site-determining protein MinC|nr:septum site-determining protein MinC [Candidatus Poribacteria bacterium]HIC02481.1 septum site-determining protein MinC [Candidatus Poribacteria bacterium]HIN31581.1 septum site-determining protein MinC [Candidatus Poribacteria bacterium]HIO49950.1 septum site-determining protein MinC [Candidatus Poribacteria bacterium]HIO78771.1 septum site-determining protein MinC [Candidatus Poribacteria bacterium]